MTNLRLLRSFLMVAECGSLAGAGDRVGLTAAAVSLQMRSLEQDFAGPLFDRGGRGLALNARGRLLRPQAERLLALYDETQASLAGGDGIGGAVAIGAVVSAMAALARAVTAVKRRHGRLEVRLVTGKAGELADQVAAGQLDAAVIVEQPGRRSSALAWTPLHTEPLVVLAPRTATDRPAADLLVGEPFLRFDRATHTGLLIDRALKAQGIPVQEFLDLNSIETIVELVRQGVGVTLVPLLKGAGWARDPRLHLVRFDDGVAVRTIGMVARRGDTRMALIAAIRDALGGGGPGPEEIA